MIDLESRKSLIRAHPFFSPFAEAEIKELAELAFEKYFGPEEVIVEEGQVVDSFYLIANGEIEADVEHVPRNLLRRGDAVGLTEVGFYSQTGLRTATLVAVSNGGLIGWSVDVFHGFLEKHPMRGETLKSAADKMLRAHFIKQATPFEDLPGTVITELAQEIAEITVAADTILFHQGDFADCCYLVCSGEVEIQIMDMAGHARIADHLGPGRLFGESALLGRPHRNATGRISQTARLLVLQKNHLDSLMEHAHTSESIMGLIVEHCRPTHSADIEHFERNSEEGLPITILKDKIHKRYYQLSEEGWFIWQQIDGQKNLHDITIEVYKAKNSFAPEAVTELILNLADAGFISLPEFATPASEPPLETLTGWQKFKARIRKWRYLQLVFPNIDPGLTRAYKAGVYLIYTTSGQITIGLTTLMGAVFFGLFLVDIPVKLPSASFLILTLVAAFFVHLLSTLLHELAHGFTVKYYNHEVHRAGIIFAWLGLAAYVDTSDMWLSPRRPRVAVSLAGPYADLVLAGVSSILAFFVPERSIALFFWLLALMFYLSVVKNLNPLRENDGYFALKDILNEPNPQVNAFNWLKRQGAPKTTSNSKAITYWLICLIFLMLNLGIAFAAQHFLRLLLPRHLFGINSDHLFWILPVFVFSTFLISLVKRARKGGISQ